MSTVYIAEWFCIGYDLVFSIIACICNYETWAQCVSIQTVCAATACCDFLSLFYTGNSSMLGIVKETYKNISHKLQEHPQMLSQNMQETESFLCCREYRENL